MDTRRPAARRRRRGAAVTLALAGACCAGVITAGALFLAGVLPAASGQAAGTAGGPGHAAGHHPGHKAGPARKHRRRPARPPVGEIGRYLVASRAMRVTDRSLSSSGGRQVPTTVRYPVVPAAEVRAGEYSRGPFPLVIFAPGYLQCRSSYASLLHAWASAGYVVAAVEFPRTHCGVPVPDEADLANQPADVSAVITRLLAVSAQGSGPLSGLIDPAAIAVAGHSDGGDTAVAVAADTCCRDRRVRAAMILSGAEWPPLSGRYFPAGTPPILFVQGTGDTWNPPAASVQLYQADRAGARYYLSLLGAGHFTPYEGHGAPEPLVARVTVDFLDAYLDGQAAKVGAMRAAGNVRGVAELTSRGRLPAG